MSGRSEPTAALWRVTRALQASLPLIGSVAGSAALIMGAVFLIGLTWNADFFAAEPEVRLMEPSRQFDHGVPPIEVVLQMSALNEATNTVQVSVSAVASEELAKQIESGEEQLTIKVLNGLSGFSKQDTVVAKFSKGTAMRVQRELWSVPVQGNMQVYRSVEPYPFDSYAQEFVVEVRGTKQLDYVNSLRLVKGFEGRRLQAKGDWAVAQVELPRPMSQKIFVVCGALVFVLVIFGVAIVLYLSPQTQTPQSLLITVSGFLLSAAGFRDVMGFSKLASFGAGEALVVGVPMLALAAALVRVVLANRWVEQGTQAATAAGETGKTPPAGSSNL